MNGEAMELTQIEYFLEVAKTEHMTQSAEHLHIAQPALSQAIRRLENELGVSLFEKKGRNIVLTECGSFLRDQLLPIKDKLDSLPNTLRQMADLSHSTVRLNVLAASTVVTNAIIEFEATHHELNFQLCQAEQDDAPDIEITTKELSTSQSGAADNRFVIPEKIFLAVPSDRFKNRRSIALSEVADEQFISLMGSKQFRYICDRFCRKSGINPKIIFESDSPAAVKNMIGARLGIGFWPEFTWGRLDNDNVRLLEISNPKCAREIVFTCKASSLENENVREFFEFLKEYCERQRGAL